VQTEQTESRPDTTPIFASINQENAMKLCLHRQFSRTALRSFVGMMALAVLLGVTSPARAYYYFYVNDGANNHIALVAEQIVPIAGGYDYQYNVLNLSPANADIDGFSIKVGAQAGLAQQVSFTPPPLNPGYGSAVNPVPAAQGGGNVTFLTAEGNTYSPVPWQFVEKDNSPAPTAYNIRWSATGNQPLPYFHFTRFDLTSPNTPIAGTGAVDPFGSPDLFQVDLDNSTSLDATMGNVLVTGTNSSDPDNAAVNPLTDLNPYDNDPNIDVGGIYNNVTAEPAPEPATLVLGLAGASLLFLARKRLSAG
jgi:hypothetical protein